MAEIVSSPMRHNAKTQIAEPVGLPLPPLLSDPPPAAPAPLPPWKPAVSRMWTKACELGNVSEDSVESARMLLIALSGWLARHHIDANFPPLSEAEQLELNRKVAAARLIYGERAAPIMEALTVVAFVMRDKPAE